MPSDNKAHNSSFLDDFNEDTGFMPPESISLLNNEGIDSTAFMLSGDVDSIQKLMAYKQEPPMPVTTFNPTSATQDNTINRQAPTSIPKSKFSLRTEPELPTEHPTLVSLVLEAFDSGYSDIHLGVGEAPRFRNRGEIEKSSHPVTSELAFRSWLCEILSEAELRTFEENLDLDTAVQYEGVRVRVNVFDSLYGYSMVLRLIPMQIATLEEMRLPNVFKDICHQKKGLILITGATGSGKSTSMAAMVDYINKEMPRHIVTIEDPIEFIHKSKQSLVKHREVGKNTQEFDKALRAVLREDPDVILIGEIRDAVTASIAIKAAQTGHLVIGTLHTNSAIKTIDRFLTLFKSEEIPSVRIAFSESLVAVISQGLCRTTDGKRAAFHDIMVATETIKDNIAKGDNEAILPLMKDGEMYGMQTINQSLFNLYLEGRITEETALELSTAENEMAILLRGGTSR